jgi:hypothetical protein
VTGETEKASPNPLFYISQNTTHIDSSSNCLALNNEGLKAQVLLERQTAV